MIRTKIGIGINLFPERYREITPEDKDQPALFSAAIKVGRATLNVLATADLLTPVLRVAIIVCNFSGSIARGRPPIFPRRRTAANPSWTIWIKEKPVALFKKKRR